VNKRYARNVRDYPRPVNWRRLPDGGYPKTCPASRHAAMVCDSFRDARSPVRKLLIDAGYDPDHWAGSIESAVQSLWEARRFLKWEALPPTKRYKFNGHWVPAQVIEAAPADKTRSGLAEGESPVTK
jgi:hypothetical protein